MGAKADRKRIFLVQHPLCCFCGGAAPSAEPDHVPSRVLFDNRQWPEGFEFPACVRCNRATRHDEQVVAMLSRLYPDAIADEGKAETYERIRAVAHNYPDILKEMEPTGDQIRVAAEKYKVTQLANVLSVRGPLINRAIENFGRKLFCALFYKHGGSIVPHEGGVAIQCWTNLQIDADSIPR